MPRPSGLFPAGRGARFSQAPPSATMAGGGCGIVRRFVQREVFPVTAIDRHQHEDRHGDGEHLDPVLDRLHQRDALHAAERDVERDDRAHHHHAHPVRQAGENVGQRRARAFHLRHRVEEPDEQHEADGDLAEHRRVVAALGEVRNRVGPEAPQRPGDEQQQEQIAARVTDRIPQRVVAGRSSPCRRRP